MTNNTTVNKIVTLSQDLNLKILVTANKTIIVISVEKTITIDNANAFLNTINFIKFSILKYGTQNILLESAEGIDSKISYYPLYL